MILKCSFSGWRIAAEQQISSIELEGYNVHEEFKRYTSKSANKAELNPCHQVFTNMREAATSIYDQYLSEKVIHLWSSFRNS